MSEIGTRYPSIFVPKPEKAPLISVPEKQPEPVTVPERELVPAR